MRGTGCLMAFGPSGGPPPRGGYSTLTLGHIISFIEEYLDQHWLRPAPHWTTVGPNGCGAAFVHYFEETEISSLEVPSGTSGHHH